MRSSLGTAGRLMAVMGVLALAACAVAAVEGLNIARDQAI